MDAQSRARGTLIVTGGGRGIGAATSVLGARHGYAVVIQDCRGRYASGGAYTPYNEDRQDGFDSVRTDKPEESIRLLPSAPKG